MRAATCLLGALTLIPGGAATQEKAEGVKWSISGEARFRPEWRDNFDLDSASDDDLRDGFIRLRLGFVVDIAEGYRVFMQAQDSREAGEESATAPVATSTNERNLDIHQGYLEIKKTGVKGLGVTAGRQEIFYGEHRLMGNFGWNNVGRAFDGVKVRLARERFFLDAFVARISNTAAAGATEGSDLFGVEYQAGVRKGAEYGAYWLEFAESLGLAGETGALGTTRIDAFGGRMKERFGRFDLNVEAVVEAGEFRGDDLSAAAFAAQGGYTGGEKTKTRAFAGYDYATGDEDSTDGERQEFFNFFPTNHLHYGYADLEGWRNIVSPYAGVSVASGRHFAQAKVHRFGLHEKGGPWKDAAGNVLGFDATGASGTNVGTEIDLTYRFSLRDKASLEGGFSRFTPGRFAENTRGDDPSHWAYVMLTVGF